MVVYNYTRSPKYGSTNVNKGAYWMATKFCCGVGYHKVKYGPLTPHE